MSDAMPDIGGTAGHELLASPDSTEPNSELKASPLAELDSQQSPQQVAQQRFQKHRNGARRGKGHQSAQQAGVHSENFGRQRPFRSTRNDVNEGFAPRRHRELFPAGTYKTEICRSHLHHGYCEYGLSCQFAHGIGELRPRHFDVKYKTQLCKNYHKDGVCRFASRCKFIHDEHRIQVDTNEFWLVSPSENLVRVEIVENAQRRQQLQALVESPPPPPPNQGTLDAELEEKKKQVLANARIAAARAAAARAAMQHASTKAMSPNDSFSQGATFLTSVAPALPVPAPVAMVSQPQLISTLSNTSDDMYDPMPTSYSLIVPMDPSSHPALAAPPFPVNVAPQGMPFYVNVPLA